MGGSVRLSSVATLVLGLVVGGAAGWFAARSALTTALVEAETANASLNRRIARALSEGDASAAAQWARVALLGNALVIAPWAEGHPADSDEFPVRVIRGIASFHAERPLFEDEPETAALDASLRRYSSTTTPR